LIAQAVETEKPPTIGIDINEKWQQVSESLQGGLLPTEKRINVDDIYKVLYFNNADPQLYNVQFWAEFFKISPASIRNIFNYLAYPEVDPVTKEVTNTLYFIDSELNEENIRKLLPEGTEIDRRIWMQYLETDYGKRMIAEHGDEAGFFGRIEAEQLFTAEIEDKGEVTIDRLDDYLGTKITDLLEDNSVMRNIEQEIKEVTDSQDNDKSKGKNMKPRE